MADLSRVGITAMALIDDLDEEIDEGHEVTDVLLVVHTRNESGNESIHSRCSNQSYLIQRGLIAWVKEVWDKAANEGDDD